MCTALAADDMFEATTLRRQIRLQHYTTWSLIDSLSQKLYLHTGSFNVFKKQIAETVLNYRMLDINNTRSNGSLLETAWNATAPDISQAMTSLVDPRVVNTVLAHHETTSPFSHDVTANVSAFDSNVSMMSATMRTATEVRTQCIDDSECKTWFESLKSGCES